MSIPTSLIFVVLVAAWLTVLVPMVARRREAVPEVEVDSGTFRVLRRASASIRRRPKFGRRDDLDDAEYAEDPHSPEELDATGALTDEELDEELLDNEDDDLSDEEFEETRYEEVRYEEVRYEETRYEEVDDVRYGPAESEPAPLQAGGGRSKGALPWRRSRPEVFAEAETYGPDSGVDDIPVHQAPVREAEYAYAAPRSEEFEGQSVRARRDPLEGVDEAQLRPVPRRHGRGGYDPDAAELARAYRYSRRRRVTVILLLATIAFSVAAYLFQPVLWSGTVVFGLLLVAYLGYLRRQVRIENDIQQRRLTRLRRARQIRPEYHLDQVEEPVTGSGFGRRDLVASQVPPSGYRRGREIVDLEDDDPSFDDLDYYQPIQYRRASGQ